MEAEPAAEATPESSAEPTAESTPEAGPINPDDSLVTNPGFEQGLTGWTLSDLGDNYDQHYTGTFDYFAHSGNMDFQFGTYRPIVSLTQALTGIDEGAVCTLSFWYMLIDYLPKGYPQGCTGPGNCYFSAAVGDQTLFDSDTDPDLLLGTGTGLGKPSTDYVLLQSSKFLYTAGSNLTFSGSHSFARICLDDIVIECSPIDLVLSGPLFSVPLTSDSTQ